MKIALDIGHNCIHDGGSAAIGNEDIMAMDTGKRLIRKLSDAGFEILLVTPDFASSQFHSLQQRVYSANAWAADFYLSIHMNAGGGRGSEVWTGSMAGKPAALNILTRLETLGFLNRGAKQQGVDGKSIFVLKYTRMPAVLVEGCFTDSGSDMELYDAEKMADAICRGMEVTFIKKAADMELQKKLNELGFKDFQGGLLAMDGIIGERTREAVMNFQKIMALRIDGIPEAETISAMEQIISKPVCRQFSKYLYAVRYLQYRLGVVIDGIFGPETCKSVVDFQSSNGLDADGIVGRKTWIKIINNM